MRLLPAPRLLLWDYGRGSPPYAVLCVVLLALLFLVTWATGALMSSLPWPKPPQRTASGAA